MGIKSGIFFLNSKFPKTTFYIKKSVSLQIRDYEADLLSADDEGEIVVCKMKLVDT